jgi:DNA recombination protein RmuC
MSLSPTTLISLLWAVANGWRQERLSANLQNVAEMSRELYDRIRVMGGHFDDLQRSLLNAVNAYNSAVGSLESRVLVQARKFKELGIQAPKEIEPLKAVEVTPRAPVADDLLRLPFEGSMAPNKKAR